MPDERFNDVFEGLDSTGSDMINEESLNKILTLLKEYIQLKNEKEGIDRTMPYELPQCAKRKQDHRPICIGY